MDFVITSFDLQIVDRKGADNPVADNLSRIDNLLHDPIPVNDSFPDEQLALIKVSSTENPWYADILTLFLPSLCLQVSPTSRRKISSTT